VTECYRPLDPIDADALAAGAEPVFAADAAAHAAGCAACGARIQAARGLLEALDGLPGPLEGVGVGVGGIGLSGGLADRVTRLRSFSARERRTYALWNAPVLLTAGLAGTGTALLTLPSLTAGEQVSVGIAASAPLLALARSAARWAGDLLALAPRGLDALSQGMRGEGTLGLVALALLVPVGLALSRVLVRAPGRR
jgi:hypothetical protein